jgi:N-acetylmuramoyl-L-alanine amidase
MGWLLQGFSLRSRGATLVRMRARVVILVVLVVGLLPASAAADYAHVVAPGETLTSVAAVDGLSIEAIAQANHMSPQAELIIGQTLLIPPRTQSNSAVPGKSYVGASEESTESTESTETSGTTSSAGPTATTRNTSYTQPSTTGPSSTAVPTRERVSGGEIAAIAGEYGVPASLAEAIAWQESGWNNDEVSSIGAVGVMQIAPATWTWIDRYLTPSDPLSAASAASNIRAGVLLLRQLLALTGGSASLAAAGYFQGLSSVRSYGMYAATRQYVADVLALQRRLGG